MSLGYGEIVGIIFAVGAVVFYLRNRANIRLAKDVQNTFRELSANRISLDEFSQRIQALVQLSSGEAGHSVTNSMSPVVTIIGIVAIAASILGWVVSRSTTPGSTNTPVMTQGQPAGATVTSKQAGDLRSLVTPLAQRLESNPNDGQGWLLLARTYSEIGQFSDAVSAFQKASKLLAPDAGLLADWAGASYSANNSKWNAQAKDLLSKALSLDPNLQKALLLAVNLAESQNDLAKASAYNERLRQLSRAPEGIQNQQRLKDEK